MNIVFLEKERETVFDVVNDFSFMCKSNKRRIFYQKHFMKTEEKHIL